MLSVGYDSPDLRQFAREIKAIGAQKMAKHVGRAVRKGAETFLGAAKQNAPERTGALKKHMRTVHRRGKLTGEFYSTAQVSEPIFYARMLEYGFNYVVVGNKPSTRAYARPGGGLVKNVLHTGPVPPQPFMRPAFESSRPQVEREANQIIGRGVAAEWKRLNR